jgi:hypothetical protein
MEAAHAAPPVGVKQPWNMSLIRDLARRDAVHWPLLKRPMPKREMFRGEQRARCGALKLERALKAPLNIALTCDLCPTPRRRGRIGSDTQPRHGSVFHGLCGAEFVTDRSGARCGANTGDW